MFRDLLLARRPVANALIFHWSDAAPTRSRLTTEQLCDVALWSAGATVGKKRLEKERRKEAAIGWKAEGMQQRVNEPVSAEKKKR